MKREPEASDGILGLLARGQIKPLGLMPNASNYTFLTEVTDSGRKALAVYNEFGDTPRAAATLEHTLNAAAADRELALRLSCASEPSAT